MTKVAAPPIRPKQAGKTLGLLCILAGMTLMVGCQGLSVGAKNQQPNGLSLNVSSLDFGSVDTGTSKTLSVTATNSGSSDVTINSAAITTKYFSLVSPALPATVTAGSSTTISVQFSPNAAGAFSATLSVTSNSSSPVPNVTLTGTGSEVTVLQGQLNSNLPSVTFTGVTVGAQQSQNVIVTNVGPGSVTISQASVSGTGFQLSGITTPVTLNQSQSTTATVTFAPKSAGSASGSLTITSDASNSPLSIPLSGTGTAAAGTLSASPSSLTFGSVTVGANQLLSTKITNTGGSSVTISQVSISGTGFTLSPVTTPITLAAGANTTISATFAPNAAGSTSGTITVTSNASNSSLSIPLSGTGISAGDLSPNPSSLSFSNVTVGSNQTQSVKVTNTGGTSVTISQAAISGTGFSLSGITTPVTVAAGASTSFNVIFAPTAAGDVTGSVTITSNATNPTLTIPLSGTGTAAVGQLSVTPTTLAIGSVVVGTSGTGTGTLSASGASVTVTAATSNNPQFVISGLSLPVTIAAGKSVSFTVTFTPTATGSASATLTFTSNAQPSTTTESVTATATAAPIYSVALVWTASTSPNISGYNIYRAVYTTACGSFTKINTLLNAGVTYTDTVVVDGTNYCYATTAVNTSNEESSYSNIVTDVQIPAP